MFAVAHTQHKRSEDVHKHALLGYGATAALALALHCTHSATGAAHSLQYIGHHMISAINTLQCLLSSTCRLSNYYKVACTLSVTDCVQGAAAALALRQCV
jgi:hypothetical protein